MAMKTTLLLGCEWSPSGSTLHTSSAADLPITLALVDALRQSARKRKFFQLESAEFLGQIARPVQPPQRPCRW